MKIARAYDFSKDDAVAAAMRDMNDVPDHELHQSILGYSLKPEWQRAAALSKAELDRRVAEDARKLVKNTTYISTGVGALAAILGAVIGAWLQSG